MTFQSSAQAGQDVFAWEVLGRKRDGVFLDLGSYDCISINNSYSLEKMGWRGLLVDIHPYEVKDRTSRFLCADATKVDWLKELAVDGLPTTIDYLSLDVDGATFEALEKMPLDKLRFGVITIEHDAYVEGDRRRAPIRKLLKEYGYDLVCSNVMIKYPGDTPNPWEDWFVSPEYSAAAEKFRCEGKLWNEILGL